jgi:leucine dehydrogenase
MSLFDHPDFDDHEHVSFFAEPSAGLHAIIAIHRTGPLGSAGGGCRIWPYADDGAALRDALRLSRAMTYKLALIELPVGGAKAVIRADPARAKTPALLAALGRAVDRLSGRFIVSEDVGTTPEDLAALRAVTPWVDPAPARALDGAEATAYGVLAGLRAGVRRRLGHTQLDRLTVAVQGLGKVGLALCHHLAAAGARLIVSDLDRARAEEAVRALAASDRAAGAPPRPGAGAGAAASSRAHREPPTLVCPPALLDAAADVFAPCALGDVLDAATVGRLRCAVVAGSANNQLADPALADVLAGRGILYLPDFALNVGGALAAATGISNDASGLRARLDQIGALVDGICARAEREHTSTHVAAERTARERWAALGGRP